MATGRTGETSRVRPAGIDLGDPTTAVGLLLLVLFAYLVALPIVLMLASGVQVQYADTRRIGADIGSFTTYYLERLLISRVAEPLFWTPLVNTLQVAVGATLLALALGLPLAWLLARSDLAGRGWWASLLIVPYILPGWTFALAWTTLFKNRTTGGHAGWFEALGVSPPDWLAYGQLPTTIILGLHYAPFVVLLVGGALKNLDSQLEEAARVLGAPAALVSRRIVLPLVRPAVLSAVILVFAECIGDFGVPYVLGLPVNFDVLATSLYRSASTSQVGVAAVLAAVILLIGMVSLSLDLLLLREARRFVTIGGRGAMERVTPLGRWRGPAQAFVVLVFVVGVVVPLSTLVLSTVMRAPGRFTLDNFTLAYWLGTGLETVGLRTGILLSPDFWAAVRNSLVIVGGASLTAGLLGLLVGYVVTRTDRRWLAATLRQITFLPYLVPGVAFAFAYLTLFAVARGPIPALYGTTLLLLLALVADQMPYASRAGISAMMQLGREPEEAARIAGAGWLRRLLVIVVPIQKRALFAGILLPFISGIKNLSLFAILAVPGTDVMTTYALRLVDFEYLQAANAVVLMVAVLSLVLATLGQRLLQVNLAEGLGR
ncbi:MAG: ABC transporter permease [Roseicyclus sp.]